MMTYHFKDVSTSTFDLPRVAVNTPSVNVPMRKWAAEPENRAENTINYFLTGQNNGYYFSSVTSCGGICDKITPQGIISDTKHPDCCSNRTKMVNENISFPIIMRKDEL